MPGTYSQDLRDRVIDAPTEMGQAVCRSRFVRWAHNSVWGRLFEAPSGCTMLLSLTGASNSSRIIVLKRQEAHMAPMQSPGRL
jgi:hypothetical protein